MENPIGQKHLVKKNDDGIRPAGKRDECFYCQRKVGEYHKDDCVMVERYWDVNVTFRVSLPFPQHWDKERIEFHLNESSSCADNILRDIVAIAQVNGCACGMCDSTAIKPSSDTTYSHTKEEADELAEAKNKLINEFLKDR